MLHNFLESYCMPGVLHNRAKQAANPYSSWTGADADGSLKLAYVSDDFSCI